MGFIRNNKMFNNNFMGHQLNDAIKELDNQQNPIYDVTNLKLIHKKCEDFHKEMPTEMKLYYNVKQNSLKGKYRYDLVYTNDDELLPDDIFDIWLEDLKKTVL
jgi:hypothetical protein